MIKLPSFASTPVKLAAALAIGTLVYAEPVAAQASTTVTTTFLVSATVSSYCTISATPMAFGTYSGAAVANGTSTVTITCTSGTTYNVGLDVGLGTGATVANRIMKSGTNTLNYNLFSNSGYTTQWGTTIGTNTVTGTGNGAAQAISVYGQIPASQFVAPASYSDTVTASVTY